MRANWIRFCKNDCGARPAKPYGDRPPRPQGERPFNDRGPRPAGPGGFKGYARELDTILQK